MAVEVPQNQEVSGGGTNEGEKEVNFAIRQRRAYAKGINVKE